MAFHVQISIAVNLSVARTGVVIVMIINRFQVTSIFVLLAQAVINADHDGPFISQHLTQSQILCQHVRPLGRSYILSLPRTLSKEIRGCLGIQLFYILPVQVRQRFALVTHDQCIDYLLQMFDLRLVKCKFEYYMNSTSFTLGCTIVLSIGPPW